MILANGKTFAGYLIERELGAGGMGTVYLATEGYPQRKVALKILNPGRDDPAFIERFRREIEIIGRLDHPNILPLYRAGVEGDQPWMALRFVDGSELSVYMQQVSLLAEGLRWLEQIAAALDYAHDSGVIHRDIKPSNILVTRSHQVYLADFGIARSLDRVTRLTGEGAAVGTPTYMAPEQIAGDEITGAADVYALAIICFEWLSGEPPYLGGSPLAIFVQHLQNPAPLHKLDRYPAGVADVFRMALAKDPKDRLQRAGFFAEMLRAAACVRPSAWPSNLPKPESKSEVVELGARTPEAEAGHISDVEDHVATKSMQPAERGFSQAVSGVSRGLLWRAGLVLVGITVASILVVRERPWQSTTRVGMVTGGDAGSPATKTEGVSWTQNLSAQRPVDVRKPDGHLEEGKAQLSGRIAREEGSQELPSDQKRSSNTSIEDAARQPNVPLGKEEIWGSPTLDSKSSNSRATDKGEVRDAQQIGRASDLTERQQRTMGGLFSRKSSMFYPSPA